MVKHRSPKPQLGVRVSLPLLLKDRLDLCLVYFLFYKKINLSILLAKQDRTAFLNISKNVINITEILQKHFTILELLVVHALCERPRRDSNP